MQEKFSFSTSTSNLFLFYPKMTNKILNIWCVIYETLVFSLKRLR